MARTPLALGFTQGRSRPLTGALLRNLYFEPAALNSRSPKFAVGPLSTTGGPAFGTPGLTLLSTPSMSSVRAMRFALGALYVLSAGTVYQCTTGGSVIACTGDMIPSSGVAMMTDNGTQLTVLSGGLCFTIVGTSVSRIVAPAYPSVGVSSIDTLDGFTLFSTAAGATTVYGASATITGITAANPPVVTAVAHGFADNSQVLIQSVVGMVEVNNRTFTIRVVTVDTFQLIGTDGTSYNAYSSGGTATPVVASNVGQWFISALYDSSVIDPLQFANAEAQPDPLQRIIVVNRDVWLFGTRTIEPWQDTGASPFPFTRITGAVMNRGTAAALSCAELTGSIFWLGDDLIVYNATGYTPQRISNYAIEEQIREAQKQYGVADTFAFTYTQDGHGFYVMTLPSAGLTFVYDIGAQVWHQRQSGTSLLPAVWTVNCVASINSTIYAGTTSGMLGIIDLDTYTEFGDPIRRVAVTPPLYNDGKRAVMPVLELECELGVGLSAGQGVDPKVMVRWSDDGGATWSNERQAPLGREGIRFNRALVRRMGIFRQREYEFAVSDAVKVCFYGYRFEPVSANS